MTEATPHTLPQKKKLALRRALLAWFRADARDLPWRRTVDPYRIWLSEILLQQTRVETAIPYYERFIGRYPTVQKLARADEQDVLKLWEGLGYYRRAHNLLKAARLIVSEFEGLIPNTLEGLERLPGVGRYTAGAIASIAYAIPAPVLDGNVKRVFARLFNVPESVDSPATLQRLWAMAEQLVPQRSPGDFNQALMELGARICIPKRPRCGECPVRTRCSAFESGTQAELPIRSKKRLVPHAEVVAAAIHKNGRYLLGRRPSGGMLEGLWEFPGGKIEDGETHKEALKREILEELAIEIDVGERIASVKHAYSHLTVNVHLYRCRHLRGQPQALQHSEIKWILRSHFDRHAFSTTNRKLMTGI